MRLKRILTYVEIAAVLVADGAVAVIAITAVSALASSKTVLAARVRSVGGGDRVGFPDIHLWAASAIFAGSGVDIVGVGCPSVRVGSTVDPLDVVWALSIAVSYANVSA